MGDSLIWSGPVTAFQEGMGRHPPKPMAPGWPHLGEVTGSPGVVQNGHVEIVSDSAGAPSASQSVHAAKTLSRKTAWRAARRPHLDPVLPERPRSPELTLTLSALCAAPVADPPPLGYSLVLINNINIISQARGQAGALPP